MPTSWLTTLLQLPRSQTVPHGLQISPSRPQTQNVGETPLLVFVGRLVTTKGVRLLIEASQMLQKEGRSYQLMIIGDGPERSSLEALVREWQLSSRISFLGQMPESQISQVFAKAELVIVPSLGGEVFGMVVAENMLRGIPVVASDLGAFVEVLGDGGLTFKTGDSADLARQISRILDDSVLSVRVGSIARQRILDNYTIDRMIEGHVQIYKQLATTNTPKG